MTKDELIAQQALQIAEFKEQLNKDCDVTVCLDDSKPDNSMEWWVLWMGIIILVPWSFGIVQIIKFCFNL